MIVCAVGRRHRPGQDDRLFVYSRRKNWSIRRFGFERRRVLLEEGVLCPRAHAGEAHGADGVVVRLTKLGSGIVVLVVLWAEAGG